MVRINRAVELLAQGQPIYYTLVRELGRANGEAAAGTWADALVIEMEHYPFDMGALGAFMEGLVAAGPTRSGHRTPAVFVTLPTDGSDEATMRANAWMAKHLLGRGVHGIILCHAEAPGAVRTLVEAMRYSFQTIGRSDRLGQGRRGHGGATFPAAIWGLSELDYLDRADVWPLNPQGELLVGLKIENHRALANAESTLAVPGVAFAEWGPGDMSLSYGYKAMVDVPELAAARTRVKAACAANGVAFLNNAHAGNITGLIDEGVRVITCSQDVAAMGRAHSRRALPW